jgi:hypothetical protein
MQGNRTSLWPFIALSVVSIGIIVLGLIAVSLDNSVKPLENAQSGADT